MIPLNYYKEYRDVCFLFKIIHGFYDINVHDFVDYYSQSQRNTRLSSSQLKIRPKKCKTSLNTPLMKKQTLFLYISVFSTASNRSRFSNAEVHTNMQLQ